MAIKSIQILNIMIFQKISKAFQLDFSDGINVLIGENGVGKTSILKMIYAATQLSFEKNNSALTKKMLEFFSNSLDNSQSLKSSTEDGLCYYKVSDGVHSFKYSLTHSDYEDWQGLNISAVFIPTTEMLSHAKGFLAMNQKYSMPFDRTQVDIIMNASLPETREIPKSCKAILDDISDAIDGIVVQEEDTFYVVKKDGRKVDFSLEAEGLRKLGLLWKLIRNGLLEKDSVLLWDEPEANLNPELYPLVANILLKLQKNGVQIFIATHSYNFAKYLEIRRTEKEQVQFHNLYRNNLESAVNVKTMCEEKFNCSNNEIVSTTAYTLEELGPNHIMMADDRLLDEVFNV